MPPKFHRNPTKRLYSNMQIAAEFHPKWQKTPLKSGRGADDSRSTMHILGTQNQHGQQSWSLWRETQQERKDDMEHLRCPGYKKEVTENEKAAYLQRSGRKTRVKKTQQPTGGKKRRLCAIYCPASAYLHPDGQTRVSIHHFEDCRWNFGLRDHAEIEFLRKYLAQEAKELKKKGVTNEAIVEQSMQIWAQQEDLLKKNFEKNKMPYVFVDHEYRLVSPHCGPNYEYGELLKLYEKVKAEPPNNRNWRYENEAEFEERLRDGMLRTLQSHKQNNKLRANAAASIAQSSEAGKNVVIAKIPKEVPCVNADAEHFNGPNINTTICANVEQPNTAFSRQEPFTPYPMVPVPNGPINTTFNANVEQPNTAISRQEPFTPYPMVPSMPNFLDSHGNGMDSQQLQQSNCSQYPMQFQQPQQPLFHLDNQYSHAYGNHAPSFVSAHWEYEQHIVPNATGFADCSMPTWQQQPQQFHQGQYIQTVPAASTFYHCQQANAYADESVQYGLLDSASQNQLPPINQLINYKK